MSNPTKIAIGVAAAIVLFLIFRPKKPTTGISGAGGGSGKDGEKPESFPLGIGMKGEKTKAVQRYLNLYYGAKLDEDGVFGSGTQAAVKKYLGTEEISAYDYESKRDLYTPSMKQFEK